VYTVNEVRAMRGLGPIGGAVTAAGWSAVAYGGGRVSGGKRTNKLVMASWQRQVRECWRRFQGE
jgi:hypothetical protein